MLPIKKFSVITTTNHPDNNLKTPNVPKIGTCTSLFKLIPSILIYNFGYSHFYKLFECI